MNQNEQLFFAWTKKQSDLIEALLITGAPYWDVIEYITATIKFVNCGLWYTQEELEIA